MSEGADYKSPNIYGYSNKRYFLKRTDLNLNRYTELQNAYAFHYVIIALSIVFSVSLSVFLIYWLGQDDRNVYSHSKKICMYFMLATCMLLLLYSVIALTITIIYSKKIEAVILLTRSMSNTVANRYLDPEIHKSMGGILEKSTGDGTEITKFLNDKAPIETPDQIKNVNENNTAYIKGPNINIDEINETLSDISKEIKNKNNTQDDLNEISGDLKKYENIYNAEFKKYTNMINERNKYYDLNPEVTRPDFSEKDKINNEMFSNLNNEIKYLMNNKKLKPKPQAPPPVPAS